MMIKVTDKIEIPRINHGGKGREPKYPWKTMKIGYSFKSEVKTSASAGVAVSYANRAYAPKIFSYRKMPNGEFRIWRVK